MDENERGEEGLEDRVEVGKMGDEKGLDGFWVGEEENMKEGGGCWGEVVI